MYMTRATYLQIYGFVCLYIFDLGQLQDKQTLQPWWAGGWPKEWKAPENSQYQK